MQYHQVYALYYSPIHKAGECAEAVARSIRPNYYTVDLTQPNVRRQIYSFGLHDLLILGVPAKDGALPEQTKEIFHNLRGRNNPTVLVLSSDQTPCDDAVEQMKALCRQRGFCCINAAVLPMEGENESEIQRFAQKVKEQLEAMEVQEEEE